MSLAFHKSLNAASLSLCKWFRRTFKAVYRAGVLLAAGTENLPAVLEYTICEGGKCSRFVLTGRHSDLPEACGRVFEIVSETKIRLRGDYCIENYADDPRTTPEQQLVTEILIPTV